MKKFGGQAIKWTGSVGEVGRKAGTWLVQR